MSTPFLIIDGYNLLHAAGMSARRYAPGEMQKRRNRLLNFLKTRLESNARKRTTVVFDAFDAPVGAPRESTCDGMQILYAPPGGDADSVIERLIQQHSAPRQIRVVSSDHRLQKAARLRRSGFVDSDVFFDELESRGPVDDSLRSPHERDSDPKYSGRVPEKETQAWMAAFGSELPREDSTDESERWDEYVSGLPENLEDLLEDEDER